MAWHRSIILTFFVFLGACSFKQGNDKPVTTEELYRKVRSAEEQELLSKKMNLDDFVFDVVPGEELNSYELVVSWKQQGVLVEIGDNSLKTSTSSSLVSPIRRPLVAGAKVTILVKAIVRNTVVFEGQVNREVPEDFEVGKSMVLSNVYRKKANRIFFGKDVNIAILQHSLYLEANEIIFDNNTIQAFSKGSKASLERKGRSAGSVFIKAKILKGNLTVITDGEDGGDGKSSYPIHASHPGCAGTKAGDGGDAGNILILVDNTEQFSLKYNLAAGYAGKVGVRGSVPREIGMRDTSVRGGPCDKDEQDAKQSDSFDGRVGHICIGRFDGSNQCDLMTNQ